ncbi:ATP-dependent DNA helicase RecG [Microbacterium amylolyticum]|uniref:Probable DNA 3'-5' helicase RecG n=1 Tax=Microbacterium amylolyticum TaxID=936337 RepID=A0ABS4ZFR6_9MICO|nr:ATP-dependent DNA helicase RecG [Microbacterium amylolyticum]MBP2435848.1 ATP-dependent DNA helicase RecG [Microbacterium amylolyticum]
MSFTLETSLATAVGEKPAKQLQRGFGMETVGDLVAHFPRRYAVRGELTPISELPVGEPATIVAEVRSASVRSMRNRRGKIVEVIIGDGQDEMSLTFFGQEWRLKELTQGRRGVFSGKVGMYRDELQFSHPDYQLFEDDGDAVRSATEFADLPIPLYPATSTVRSWEVSKLIATVLDQLGPVPDPLSDEMRAQQKMLPAREALEKIHRPRTEIDHRHARHTLRMHEALVMQTALLQQRLLVKSAAATPRPAQPGGLLERFDRALSFTLTPDQETVGAQLAADLVSDSPMNRLVQGEVGSGKTLVALRAMLQAIETGGQCALIAPTEVLAGQHIRSITKMLGPDIAAEVIPTLLTGQMAAADRRRASLRVASGQARIVVGTHALLSDKTTFADLGFVVVDEQHRFGVEQRETLRAKGTHPHVLVLTATPIPRTVAMTVFGDLDVSTIRTMPAGRAGIETYVAPIAEKPAWFHRVWERTAEEVANGHQVFVVCAAIDTEGDGSAVQDDGTVLEAPPEGGPKGPRFGVVQVAELLGHQTSTSHLRIAILHGRMPGDEKDTIMQSFARGDIDVIVATTVIEVGVDVPNASTMVILDADRFGVSQLHQLRGRVGRGEVPGLCLLVTEALIASPARDRVDAVAATLDGFELAEVDLELRGEGDVLGDTQSGMRSSLKLLRVVKDASLIQQARGIAQGILDEDPTLEGHPELAVLLAARVSSEERAALRKN